MTHDRQHALLRLTEFALAKGPMNWRFVLAMLLMLNSTTAVAQRGGALGGMGEAMQSIGRQGLEAELQRERMREQHRLEMERMEREHALRMDMLRKEAEERARPPRQQQEQQEHQEQRARELERQRSYAAVESVHPGWRSLVRTADFKAWHEKQPASVQRLGGSDKAEDAITILDLYKRDRGITDTRHGEWNACAAEGVQIGHTLTHVDGRTGKVERIFGRSERCQGGKHPILISVAFDATARK